MNPRFKQCINYIAMPAILLTAFSLAVAMVSTAGKSSTAFGDAGSVYNKQCAGCHGRDGRARTARAKRERARDMTGAEWQDGVSDERLYNSISNGKGKMPAFKKKLSESQIDELVSYIRRLRR